MHLENIPAQRTDSREMGQRSVRVSLRTDVLLHHLVFKTSFSSILDLMSLIICVPPPQPPQPHTHVSGLPAQRAPPPSSVPQMNEEILTSDGPERHKSSDESGENKWCVYCPHCSFLVDSSKTLSFHHKRYSKKVY